MKLVFTKGSHKNDRMDVLHADGAVESIDCPKQGIIPHDMVHYAVENVLRVRGFLARVASGEAAMLTMQAEPHSDAVERLVEVFQGDGWSGGATPPDEMIALYHVTCEARRCPMLPVEPSDIVAVRDRIAELTGLWTGVPVGGSLTLTFDT
jgi:hypothetical protein